MISFETKDHHIKKHLFYIEETFREYVLLCENNFQNSIKEARKDFEKFQQEYEINGHFSGIITHPEDDDYAAEMRYVGYKEELSNCIFQRNEFIFRFRNSLVFQLFSIFESELKGFCLRHSKINNKEYSIKDLGGSDDLEKAKKYLSRSAGIEIPSLEPEWNFIQDFRKLRNLIVHHDSTIENTHKDFKSIERFSKDNFRLEDFSRSYSKVKKETTNEKIYYTIILDNEFFLNKAITQVFSIIDTVYYVSQ